MMIAITGHRPGKLGGYRPKNPTEVGIRNKLGDILSRAKLRYRDQLSIISGMALGVDTWWAEAALGRDIPVHAYIPFEGQQRKWPRESQDQYWDLLDQIQTTGTVRYVCDPGYAAWKLMERNKAMVRDCDVLVAVWDGLKTGGTYHCISWAQENSSCPILHLHPDTLREEWLRY